MTKINTETNRKIKDYDKEKKEADKFEKVPNKLKTNY